MTNHAARTSIAIALVATLFAGCSNEVKRTGFIPKSVTMKSGENQSHKWAADSKKLAAFGKVVVWPTETPAGNAYGDLDPEKLATLRGLLEKSIKESGDHEVPVRLHPDVTAKLRVKVSASTPEAEEADEEAPKKKANS